jgi:hypothetical protein
MQLHHQRDSSVSDDSQAPLFVVDLASSRLAQPMVRRAARRAIARAVAAAHNGKGRIPRPRVLLHGEDGTFVRIGDIELLSTLDYALPHVGSADEPWVNEASNELLYGSGAQFFPVVDGVSLADLCRLEVQDYYLDYAHLAGALCRVLAEKPTSICTIFTIDPERADALRISISDLVADAKSWTPPFIAGLRQIGRMLHRIRRRRAGGQAKRLSAIRISPRRASLKAPVLFVSEAAPMAQMFDVVERHLKKLNDERSLRLELTGSRETIAIENGAAAVVATFGHPSALVRGRQGRFSGQWRTTARESHRIVIEKPYIGAAGVGSLRAPVRHLLEHLYSERFDQVFEHLEFARAFVDVARPEVLVVGNDRWWVGQAFVRAAQQRGIPTVLIQDGLACDKASWSWISADHVAAFSPVLAELLVSHGVSRDRIAITGQPRYDSLCKKRYTRDSGSIRAARAKLGTSTGPCVLLATQPHQDADRVAKAVEALLQIDGVHVLLRPHPSEFVGKYAHCVMVNPGRVLLARGMDIDALLDAADVVVTEYSTVALEGAMLGIPVIIASFLGDRSDPRVFDGFSVAVRSPEALYEAAQAFCQSRTAEHLIDAERLHSLVGPLDGQSGLRVAHLIHSLRRSHKHQNDLRSRSLLPLQGSDTPSGAEATLSARH